VVEVSTAFGRVEDTTRVELELEGVSFNGNKGGGTCNSGLKSNVAVCLNHCVALGPCWCNLARVIGAVLIRSSVRIVLFGHEALISDIVKCAILITTVAPHAATVVAAVDKLLLGEAVESATLDLVS